MDRNGWGSSADHPLRKIDRLLDLTELREGLRYLHSHTGRPSVDPELMIRMMIVGYLYGIRSETRLCQEVLLNLAYRWFCKLGTEGRVPERSTFSKNRHCRFAEGYVPRRVFDMVVARCADAGLVCGVSVLVDGSTVEADANRARRDSPERNFGFMDTPKLQSSARNRSKPYSSITAQTPLQPARSEAWALFRGN